MRNEHGIKLIKLIFIEVIIIVLLGVVLLSSHNIISFIARMFLLANSFETVSEEEYDSIINVTKLPLDENGNESAEIIFLKNQNYSLDFEFETQEKNKDYLNVINYGDEYKIIEYGIQVNVLVNEEKNTLSEAINKNIITTADLFEKIQDDLNNKICLENIIDSLEEYDSAVLTAQYKYDTYYIYKKRTNSNYYIIFSKYDLDSDTLNDFSADLKKSNTQESNANDFSDIKFICKDNEDNKINTIAKDNLYILNTFNKDVLVEIDEKRYSLRYALKNELISIKDIIDKCEEDVKNNNISLVEYEVEDYNDTSLRYRIYAYGSYDILIQYKSTSEQPTIAFIESGSSYFIGHSLKVDDYLKKKVIIN